MEVYSAVSGTLEWERPRGKSHLQEVTVEAGRVRFSVEMKRGRREEKGDRERERERNRQSLKANTAGMNQRRQRRN